MHFVTGGAFNGKRAWVKENYPGCEWISTYEGDLVVENLEILSSSAVVIEGIEVWTKEMCANLTIDKARKYINDVLTGWLDWENAVCNRKVIVIGTDITKGIVPIDKKDRNWRDLTGWAYQDFTSKCERVDVIWYGLNQTLKK